MQNNRTTLPYRLWVWAADEPQKNPAMLSQKSHLQSHYNCLRTDINSSFSFASVRIYWISTWSWNIIVLLSWHHSPDEVWLHNNFEYTHLGPIQLSLCTQSNQLIKQQWVLFIPFFCPVFRLSGYIQAASPHWKRKIFKCTRCLVFIFYFIFLYLNDLSLFLFRVKNLLEFSISQIQDSKTVKCSHTTSE